jgi:hypothetical protein
MATERYRETVSCFLAHLLAVHCFPQFDIGDRNDFLSPAMLYRKINDLLSLELVELVYEGSNRRTKYLIPTPKALVFADEMADAAAHIYQSTNA